MAGHAATRRRPRERSDECTEGDVLWPEDGIVVHDGAPSLDPGRLRLVRGAGSGLRLLRDAGYFVSRDL